MSAPADHEPQISQRDLRHRSREIMDAVESGQTYAVTRDGRVIGRLVPERVPRRFVTRDRFTHLFRGSRGPDLEHFRADQDENLEQETSDPYAH